MSVSLCCSQLRPLSSGNKCDSKRAVILVSRFSFIWLYFELPNPPATIIPHRFPTEPQRRGVFPAKSRRRLHPRPRSHPIKPPHRYCSTTTTTSTSNTLNNKRPPQHQTPRSLHTTPPPSLQHHYHNQRHRVEAIHRSRQNRETSLVTVFRPLLPPVSRGRGEKKVEAW